MALIKCPECGKEISDRASACIHCGAPLNVTTGRLMIKAQKYPDPKPTVTREIGIYETSGKKIATLHTGTGITVDISQDVDIYAQLDKMWLVKPSNILHISSSKTTRVAISFQTNWFSTKVILSEVDMIDSE